MQTTCPKVLPATLAIAGQQHLVMVQFRAVAPRLHSPPNSVSEVLFVNVVLPSMVKSDPSMKIAPVLGEKRTPIERKVCIPLTGDGGIFCTSTY